MVTWNGVPFKLDMSRAAAEAFAERWQGKRYKSGMMKHGDKQDYFEVKRDLNSEREFDKRYADFKDDKPQTIIIQHEG